MCVVTVVSSEPCGEESIVRRFGKRTTGETITESGTLIPVGVS